MCFSPAYLLFVVNTSNRAGDNSHHYKRACDKREKRRIETDPMHSNDSDIPRLVFRK